MTLEKFVLADLHFERFKNALHGIRRNLLQPPLPVFVGSSLRFFSEKTDFSDFKIR